MALYISNKNAVKTFLKGLDLGSMCWTCQNDDMCLLLDMCHHLSGSSALDTLDLSLTLKSNSNVSRWGLVRGQI